MLQACLALAEVQHDSMDSTIWFLIEIDLLITNIKNQILAWAHFSWVEYLERGFRKILKKTNYELKQTKNW